jgi:hypothetical protein
MLRKAGGAVIDPLKSIAISLIKTIWAYLVIGVAVAIVAILPITDEQKINALCVIFGVAVSVSVAWLIIKPLLSVKKIYNIIKGKGGSK